MFAQSHRSKIRTALVAVGQITSPPARQRVPLHPIADISTGDVTDQEQTTCTAVKLWLFDHLVGGLFQTQRHVEAQRLGGLEIDGQFEFGRRLYRKIGRLLALEDAIDVAGRAPVWVDRIRTIRDQATIVDEET